ncbi:MAG TPA: YceI family protein [Bacteroidia bacterium]|nr:YceI family protein [Bacteroidia bacterium]
MKKSILVVVMALISAATFGQKYFTKTGHVSFFSDAALEDIEAHNYQTTALLNSSTGAMAFKVPIKGFEFKKALMQEHFNENYMDSDSFPEATFDGTIEDLKKVDFTKAGTYDVTVKGKLTIHGVTKEVSVPGKIVVDPDKKVTTNATFKVALKDYNIKNDKVQNISNDIEIRVNVEMPKK